MRTTSLAATCATIALALTSLAHAVALNPKGLGQVLIYPYYTVNKNQDTLVTIVNTSDLGKVIQVDIHEGYNGRMIYNFNLFLSPHDVWTARISQDGNSEGGARIFTADKSCAYPALPSDGLLLREFAYAGGSAWPADEGPTSVTRTREGQIQMFELGEIMPDSPLAAAIVHVQGNGPNTGASACTPAAIGNNAVQHLTPPRGGLFGTASIINVGEGTFFAYNADALADFSQLVLFSGSASPLDLLAVANSSPDGRANASLWSSAGEMMTLNYANGIDAVSAVYTADAISNDYLVDASLGANTDWIVTFPTKRFYTDPARLAGSVLPPFTELFHAPGVSNVAFGFRAYDREEGTTIDSCDFGCGTLPPKTLPYEVNALTFSDPTAQQASGVLGSALTTRVASYGNSGWAQLDLNPEGESHLLTAGSTSSGASVVLKGLPVTGFMVYNVINSNAQPGKLANYSGLFPHRATVSCTSNASLPAQDPCS